MRTANKILLVALACLAPLPALAADDAVSTKVKELAKQAQVDTDAGRYDAALQSLQQAYQLAKVPALARNIARVLAKQGKLVQACKFYQEAVSLQPNSLWRLQIQQTAQHDAATERTELLARLAHLNIGIEGVPADAATVQMDDAAVEKSQVGTEQDVDPGMHHLVAKSGEKQVEQNVELKEGEHRQVVLRFGVEPAAAGAAGNSVSEPPKVTTGSGHRLQPTLGWIGVGVGAAGIVFGATTGLVAMTKRSGMHNDGCRDNWCPSSFSGRVDSYNQLRTLSTVGFIAGAVVEAAGITLLLTTPRRTEAAETTFAIGPGSFAIKGGF